MHKGNSNLDFPDGQVIGSRPPIIETMLIVGGIICCGAFANRLCITNFEEIMEPHLAQMINQEEEDEMMENNFWEPSSRIKDPSFLHLQRNMLLHTVTHYDVLQGTTT